MTTPPIQNIAVIGLGTIGHSVAQVYAAAGCTVKCFDPDPTTGASLADRVRTNLKQMSAAGLSSLDDIETIVSRFVICDNEAETVSGVGFVSEAAAEDLTIKQALFSRLENHIDRHTILASNTSTYPMTQISRDMVHPDRALVTHPFNPPHLLPIIEVVPGESTSEQTVSAAMALIEHTGKKPIRLNREMPGFLINRIQMAMVREVWDLLDQGVASAEDIDAAVRGSLGFRLAAIGPLSVCDFAGLDIWAKVFRNLATEISADHEIPATVRELVDEGHYGTKTKRGFFDYSDKTSLTDRTDERDRGFLEILKLFHSN